MGAIYANRFSITTNENKESFLVFYLDVPKYNENNEYEKMETVESQMIILSNEGYDNFRQMLDQAEAKEENK